MRPLRASEVAAFRRWLLAVIRAGRTSTPHGDLVSAREVLRELDRRLKRAK